MSQTISFVASDELAEYLEQEAERRMTTVSSTAQMLLAEKYREERAEDASETASEVGESDAFDRNPDVWYESDGKHKIAVYVPEDADTHDAGGRRYYKTVAGAEKAIKQWYE